MLDRRSDELAESIFEPLTESQRERLVAALGEVERLFSLALVRFETADVTRPEAQRCLQAYAAELDRASPALAPSWPEMAATLDTAPAAARALRASRRCARSRSAAAG